MKQKSTFKSVLFFVCLLSLSAFVFVNLPAKDNVANAQAASFEQTQVENEAPESRQIAVPDVTVLGRLWEITQRLIERNN